VESQESVCSLMPWRGALAALIWSSGLGHVQRIRLSRPGGREPEEGRTSYLDLQGRLSCLGVSVRLNVVVVMVFCPCRGMGWHGATVPVTMVVLAHWWFASRPA
jgi:hypothetical protein